VRQDPTRARSLALATLILGYQILVLVERAASAEGRGAFWPRSVSSWLVWGAAAASLPILMYLPGMAALMSIAPLAPRDWLIALVLAVAAVGWRMVVPKRPWRVPSAGPEMSVD
jgi:hypothetical protein